MLGYAILRNKTFIRNFILENQPKNNSFSRIYRGGWYWDHCHEIDREISVNDYTRNLFEEKTIGLDHALDEFFALVTHLETENQRLVCYKKGNIACVVGYADNRYLMPTEFFQIEELKDYSALTAGELKALGGSVSETGDLPAELNGISKNTIEEKQEECRDKLEALQQEAEDIKSAKSGELRKMQEEIEKMQMELRKKQESLIAELAKKQEEMQLQMDKLKNQMTILDTQIYSIRCYLGEVIDFATVQTGKSAATDEPLVIYQKIRFINEELGKYMGMYNVPITSEEASTFLHILKNRSDIRDLFVPGEKCITVLKASRDGKYKAPHEQFSNLLDDYEAYHGKQIAIMVRNGENIYIGWTDDERVLISTEDVFYVPKTATYSQEPETEMHSSKADMVSRLYIMSLVQGLKDNSRLIPLPEDVNVLKPNPYVVFSAAEGWLTDDTYGTYETILEKSAKITLKEGDFILTAMSIGRDDGHTTRYKSYNNDRGIGERNRTHDSHIPGLKVLPINKVLYDANVEYVYEMYEAEIDQNKPSDYPNFHFYKATNRKVGEGTDTHTYYFEEWRERKENGLTTEKNLVNNINSELTSYIFSKESDPFTPGREHLVKRSITSSVQDKTTLSYHVRKCIGIKSIELIPHYFVSTSSRSWFSDKPYHVNMEIMEHEYHPLAYLCPTWIRYCIKTANIGTIRLCGKQMTYADLLRDFNIMLEHLNEVQQQEKIYLEKAGLGAWMEKTPDWDVIVTEWRIANKKRKLTEAGARRFARELFSS